MEGKSDGRFLAESSEESNCPHYRILHSMKRIILVACVLFSLLAAGTAAQDNAPAAKEQEDFSGNWVMRLGGRPLLLISLKADLKKQDEYAGFVMRPKSFSTSDGIRFSSVQSLVVQYPITATTIEGRCLSLTAQNPADESDKDSYLLCPTETGKGTLKLNPAQNEASPVALETGSPSIAANWDPSCTYSSEEAVDSNPEMKRIYDEDQKDREPGVGKIDWTVVSKVDAARRELARKLLAGGSLHTGDDFERAAFVFQHGETPNDYLLAHTLAMVAVARGQGGALWIAAATLDRYLNSIQQPQIYGTQFWFKENQPTTQEPYNRGLISDSLRQALGVPPQSAQEERRKQIEAERARQ